MASQLRILKTNGVGGCGCPACRASELPKAANRHPLPTPPLDGGSDSYRPTHSGPPDPPGNGPLAGQPRRVITWDRSAPAPEPPTLAPEDFIRTNKESR